MCGLSNFSVCPSDAIFPARNQLHTSKAIAKQNILLNQNQNLGKYNQPNI